MKIIPAIDIKGGKCVLCIAVVGSFISWQVVLIALACFVIIMILTRIVSASSICAMLTAIVAALFINLPINRAAFIIIACSFVVFMHRSNISRIINGTEKKITVKGGQK